MTGLTNHGAYLMQCLCGCGQEITSKRLHAKFYSSSCRSRYNRATDNQLSVANIPTDATDNWPNATDISPDIPCKVPTQSARIDIERDLKLHMHRDLGITAWTPNGIMIRPNITISQVHAIAKLIHATHHRPCPDFRCCK